MNKLYVYSDESCHIKNDDYDIMALACVYCSDLNRKMITNNIKKIIEYHEFSSSLELKWGKISNSNVEMYKDIFSYISEMSKLGLFGIRGIVIKGKKNIVGDFDEFYHKMYYLLFKTILDNTLKYYSGYTLFLDNKDTYSNIKVPVIGKYLSNSIYNFTTLNSICADSKEHILIQVSDIIAGALTYKNRFLDTSSAKLSLIKHIEVKFGVNLLKTTPKSRLDFNIFVWKSQHA